MRARVPTIIRRTVPELAEGTLHSHPVIERVFAARGVHTVEELNTSLSGLLTASTLGNTEAAVALLSQSIRKQRCIVIVGDYDADGATSTAVAMKLLRAMGAQHVHYFVPDRFRYGYGLNPQVVESLLTLKPDLLITVDNGIASVEGVDAARQRGIDVLVTDHHLPPAQLPNANVIVNPNLAGDRFASKNLAGVGVIFYLLSALRTHLRDTGWFDEIELPPPNTAECLDLVALGTVADVVPLDSNNRILVEQGLRRIRAGKMCPGVAALLEVAGRDSTSVVASDLAFAAGPRLNAAGRLEDMSLGIACLLAESDLEAREVAVKLDALNRERRTIEAEMREQADALLENWLENNAGVELPHGVCLFDPAWHEGVIGILAGRVREAVNRPTIIFTSDSNGGVKGSARSVTGVHIRDVIAYIDSRNPGLIERFGGHAMAAGLSMPEGGVDVFAEAFADGVQQHLQGRDLEDVVHTDGELQADHFTLEFAEQIRYAAPWGQHFPEPLFEGEFNCLQRRIVGQNHLKMTLQPKAFPQVQLDAIAFNETCDELGSELLRVVYKLDVNTFRGESKVQLLVDYICDADTVD